ncbi:MAG: hypothetical protein MH137_06200 [Flavobacteriales bacterium]|nr:hypothetical protein [Flavobacteriales bacterium]
MKSIKVKVINKWLNALEDVLFAELTEEEALRKRKQATKLWRSLVKAHDKKG